VGNIENNGSVIFDYSGNYNYMSDISGSGSLIKEGAGDLILSGGNTYTGGTMISNGMLIISGSVIGNIINNGQLAFAQITNYTFNGNIFGSGAIVFSRLETFL
jgi:autotransporter-associated beta strand protein